MPSHATISNEIGMRSRFRPVAFVAIVAAATVAVLTARAQPAPVPVPRGVTTITPSPTSTSTPTVTPTPTLEARIGLYANAAANVCQIDTNLFNPFNVFVVAKNMPGLRGANFRINNLGPNILEVVPSRTPHPQATVVGTPSAAGGTQVSFDDCQTLPIQIFRLTYVPAEEQLRDINVANSSGESCPFVLACDGTTEVCVTGGTLRLNGSLACSEPITPTPTRTFTPTRTSTVTRTPTSGPSPTSTRTPTSTATTTSTRTATATATETGTPTITSTPTATPSITSTPTETSTPSITPTPSQTPTASLTPTASNTPVCDASRYDVDDNGEVEPLSDGLLILRYLFEFTGSVLTQGAIGQGAQRTDAAEIIDHLDCLRPTLLDPDGNGLAQPLSDGLLLLRYFFGFRGATLITGAVGVGCTRCDAPSIEAFIEAGLS
jgi:hypothetical protein